MGSENSSNPVVVYIYTRNRYNPLQYAQAHFALHLTCHHFDFCNALCFACANTHASAIANDDTNHSTNRHAIANDDADAALRR